MLYKDKIKNLPAVYLMLTRVWVKTGDPKAPLKGVWMNESKLHRVANKPDPANRENESAELTEDHLALAA